jgi:ATP/ADP translocase
MKERIGRFLNIRQDESLYVSYLLFHYFFQGIGLALFATVANALFLSHFSEEELPLVFIGSAVLIMVLGKVNDYFGARWPVPKMLKALAIFCAVSVLVFYTGTQFFKGLVWIPFALYLWYKVVESQIDLEFWGLASIIFDVRQAKRLFGLISAGDVPAKLLGFLSVAVLVPLIGLTNLLVISSASFMVGALLLQRLLSNLKPHHFEHHESHTHSEKSKEKNILLKFFQSDLVMALALLYFIAAVTITFTEFSFLSEVEHKMAKETQLAYFFGLVFSVGNGLIIIFKLFLSGKAIDRLGIKRSLLSLPLFLLLVSLAVLVTGRFATDESPMMWLFTAMVIFGEVFKAVLYEPLFLALFQPLTAHLRHHAHGIMNGFINPMGLGISGMALYGGIQLYHSINLYKINYVLLVLIICWTVLVLFAVKKYMATLKNAINKRLINSRQLNLGDTKSLDILKTRLLSNRPDEVIYTADMLVKTQPAVFERALPQLLANPEKEVRLFALNKISEQKLKPGSEELYRIIVSDPAPEVQEIAVKIYCALYEDIVDRVTPMLDYPDLQVRSAAIKGFLRSGDLEAMMIGGQQLMNLLQSKNDQEIIEAVDIIGDLGFKNYYKPLLSLISHENFEIRKMAVLACGKTGNPKLIPYLMRCLEEKGLKKAGIESLGRIGPPVLEYIAGPDYKERNTLDGIRLCSRIGGQRATEILFSRNFSHAKAGILDEVLKALSRLPIDLKSFGQVITHKLNAEIHFAHTCAAMIRGVANASADVLLFNALQEEMQNSKNRIFILLSLLFDRPTIEKARNAAFSWHKEIRANAIEYLDNILDHELKSRLFPLIDSGEEQPSSATHQRNPGHGTVDKIIHEILGGQNNDFLSWTHAVALYKFHPLIEENLIKLYTGSAERLVAQCAEYALMQSLKPNQKMHPEKHHHHAHESMLEIEKVLILKSTNMFASTPENILAGIAGIAIEELVQKGADIFKKGDPGNCLFIICEGDISIHVDGKQLSVLHSRDIFGELALLDPEPRSASATALNDCLLLRIDQGAFNELIEERPEVAQGILTILSRRIRKQNMVIRELQTAELSPQSSEVIE